MSLQALRDEIIVRPVFEKHKGLIAIPQLAFKYKQYDGQVFGEVVSIGKQYPYELKAGDRICWMRNEGKKFVFEGQVYFAIRKRWVLGLVN